MAFGGEFLTRIKLHLEGKERVVSGLSETQRAAQQLAKTKITTVFDKEGLATGKRIEETFTKVGGESKKAFHQMGDFEKALRRVVLVAPVWMAFRTAMMEFFSILKDGLKTWENFDKQLIKSKAVIHDFSGTTEQAMGQLESTIRSFSKESGLALDQLTSAFYRFGTVGIGFKDALSGAIASAKLAKATFSDVDTVSRSMAMTYRLLGDSIDQTLSPMEKQESLAGKVLHLWKTNAFEANEFSQSLNNFVSQANIVNFTADQTIALLSALGTAGVQGARGGRLLRTSLSKLVENLDELAPKLGLAVNPELENTFDLFMRVLDTINKLSQTKGIPAAAMESIKEIFGGVRGGQVIAALNAILPEVKKNLEELGKDPQQYIVGLNNRLNEVTDSVSGQLEIFRRAREQLGEAFVQGVAGADDFKNALIRINDAMYDYEIAVGAIGRFIYKTIHPLENANQATIKTAQSTIEFGKRVKEAMAGTLSLQETIEMISIVSQKWEKNAFTESVIKRIQETANTIAKTNSVYDKLESLCGYFNEELAESNDLTKEQFLANQNLLNELNLQTKTSQAGLDIIRLQARGYEDSQIALAEIIQEVSEIVDLYNGLDKVMDGTLQKLDKQTILTDVLNRNWQGIINKAKGNVAIVGELLNLAKSRDKLESAIVQQFAKQDQAIRNQYMAYEKADKFEKNRLRRLMELQAMDSTKLADAFKGDVYDRRIITEYWSAFNKEGQDAVNTILQRMYNLPRLNMNAILSEPLTQQRTTTQALPNIANNIIGAQMRDIIINLPDMNWESLADRAGQSVADKLKSDSTFQELIARGIRSKI